MPLVSVITPFYNTAEYLGECIEGVLAQTLGDFEYVLVDNASTDGSLEIARSWAGKDARIRVVHFDELLRQIPNYNRALRCADPRARYCKLAQADDVLLPRCLEDMVAVAESDPEVSMVGAYTLVQNRVFLDGLDYYERILDGNDLCRRYLLDGRYVFGNPTTQLYRMADVQARPAFYDEASVIADADAAVRLLIGRKFGFVHQVLSFTRRSNDSISEASKDYNINIITRRMLLETYGQALLDGATYQRRRVVLARRHYRVLGEGLLKRRGAPFWELHRNGLQRVGLRIAKPAVIAGAIVVLLRWGLDLLTTARLLGTYARRRQGVR